ncbi:unnamed protein product [Periconia digitata]|uniref:Uncharacterized protein n=1 Tax=Periconia digitata TaxID=1303443 RepID=A0A9W4XR60_9PLEO|nr:unnamed protein product [Periconia digitata]
MNANDGQKKPYHQSSSRTLSPDPQSSSSIPSNLSTRPPTTVERRIRSVRNLLESALLKLNTLEAKFAQPAASQHQEHLQEQSGSDPDTQNTTSETLLRQNYAATREDDGGEAEVRSGMMSPEAFFPMDLEKEERIRQERKQALLEEEAREQKEEQEQQQARLQIQRCGQKYGGFWYVLFTSPPFLLPFLLLSFHLPSSSLLHLFFSFFTPFARTCFFFMFLLVHFFDWCLQPQMYATHQTILFPRRAFHVVHHARADGGENPRVCDDAVQR